MIKTETIYKSKKRSINIEEDMIYIDSVYRIDTRFNRVYFFDHDWSEDIQFTREHQEDCINWCLEEMEENGY